MFLEQKLILYLSIIKNYFLKPQTANFWNVDFQTQVVFQHYVISNLDQYFPRPDQFIPERWLKICPESKQGQNYHPFASLPFGYGRRMCLGRRFADLEIQMVITKVGYNTVCKYRFKFIMPI